MAITEVGTGSQRAAGGNNNAVDSFTALAFPGNVTIGSLMVVAGAAWGSSAAPTGITVTDTRSTVYTVVLGTVGSGLTWRTFIAYGVAGSSGACSVTVNPAGADGTHSGSFSIDEFTASPNTIAASVDGGTTTGLSGTGTISDTITTGIENELIIAVLSDDGAGNTMTVAGSGTLIGENEVNTNNQCHAAQFRIVTTVTSYSMSWTVGGGGASGATIQTHSFKQVDTAPRFILGTH